MFKPGKNCDGYFDSKELITQVNRAITRFEGKANGLAQGLFMFDNAPSHLKHADDALSAVKMVKSECFIFFKLLSLMSLKIPSMTERTTQRGHTCMMGSIH